MIPLPGIEQVNAFAEWQEMADVVRDGVMAAIHQGEGIVHIIPVG